jgi:hypothetical protein
MKDAYVLLGADREKLMELSRQLFDTDESAAIHLAPGNPIDFLEELPRKLAEAGQKLCRIISLVDAAQLERRGELAPWFEMLCHFSDVVLLENTQPVSPAWLSALKKRVKGTPLLLAEWPLRGNGIPTGEIIYPEARRISQYFEDEVGDGIPIFSGDDDETVDEEDDPPVEERYFVRDAAGRRFVKIVAP